MRKIIILFILCLCSNLYGAYDETVLKDMGTNTPLGTENPGTLDDKLRQLSRLLETQYHEKLLTVSGTATTTDTYIIGSSSSGILCTLPSASSVANGTTTKIFVVKNRGAGTITLSPTVDGVGSPTVSQNQAMTLFTDGTSWFEVRAANAGDADTLDGINGVGYARSGANSDITAVTGLTTYLAVGQGGSGTNTAAGAASAFGVGTEDSPEFTGLNVTSTGTITHFGATNGTITNLLATRGTVTTLYSTTGNITNQTTTTGTVTTLYSTTGNVTNLVTTTGTVTTLYSTTGNITTGNITNQVTTTGTVTTLNSTTGNVTNLNTTTGTVTTLYSTTGNITNQVTTTGTITTLNNTNLTTTTGTITTLYNTNFSGGSGTLTGNIEATSASGFNYLKSWTTGSQTTAATGTVRFNSTGDIVTSSTYDGNGNGTITTALSAGVSAKPDAKVDGVVQVSNPTAYDFPGAFVSIAATGTDALLTFKPISLATQTNNLLSFATQTTGRLSMATQTTGLLSLGTQTNGLLSLATQTSNLLSFATQTTGLLSLATQTNRLIDVISFIGTTTEQPASVYGQLYVKKDTLLSTNIVGSFGTLTTTSLVSYYRLTDLTDNFGGNSLTNYGTTTFVAGKYGNCATFNGTSQYLQTSLLSNATANISMFGWVYIPSASELTAFFNNGVDGADTNGYGLGVGGANSTTAGNNLIVSLHAVNWFNFGTAIGTGWHHVGVTRDATTWRGYIDKVQCVNTMTDTPNVPSGNFTIGRHNVSAINRYHNDKIDDVVFYNKTLSAGEIKELYDNTGDKVSYDTYSAKYIDPVNGRAILGLFTPGTATTEATYIYCNATTTVFGLGTNTAITATATAYTGWFDGAVRATAFNVASTEKIKDNIQAIEIKPGLLDAEDEAKKKYITDSKSAWIIANQNKYESAVIEIGTGTVTKIDTQTMESDYIRDIEVQWASDLNRNALIENVQKEHETKFWLGYGSMQPKSWNPKDKPNLTRRGFVVEEIPDEFKGDDKQTIDLMAFLAYTTSVLQFEKAEIGSLTAALENQKIAYNEEVDNLYQLINAIIVALLAVGGVSGWSTIRRKRKGT